MEILNYSQEHFKVFVLILIRISVVLFLFPVFGSRVFPTLVKAGLALIIAATLLPVVTAENFSFPENTIHIAILIVSEFMIGLIIGLIARLFFSATQIAGHVIAFQMGFGMINVLDPQTGAQVSILDQIAYWMVLLIFLILNGHHILITCLADSFRIVEPGMIHLNKELLLQILGSSSDMFILAIKVGAPGIVSLLFVSTAFGLCAKFAPQMNILIAAFPVKIIVGLFFFCTTLHLIALSVRSYIHDFKPALSTLLAQMGGG